MTLSRHSLAKVDPSRVALLATALTLAQGLGCSGPGCVDSQSAPKPLKLDIVLPWCGAWCGEPPDGGVPPIERIGLGTAESPPAIAVYDDELYLAWQSVDHAIAWTRFDGVAWAPVQTIPGVGTSASPTLAVYHHRLTALWRGIEPNRSLWSSSFDGTAWAPQVVVGPYPTIESPALAAWGCDLYVAWQAADTNELWWSSFDGTAWAPPRQIERTATSTGITLAGADDGKLYAAWKGYADDPGIWYATFDGATWSAQRNVAAAETSTRPALATGGGKVYLAWNGVENDPSVWWTNFNGAGVAPWQPARGATTAASPAIVIWGSELCAAWKGAGLDSKGVYVACGFKRAKLPP